MAKVYVSASDKIDEEVLEAVGLLPDDFWVFAEFNIGRNVDWFVVREAPSAHAPERGSTLIVTELKRLSRPLRGASSDVPWETLDDGGDWQEVTPSNEGDVNHYWQAVNTANALAEWLWNNQRRYREAADIRPQAEFRAWPDLLLLSPPGTVHRLPLGPSSKYGRWWYGLNEWRQHLMTWNPRQGAIALTAKELENLAGILGLRLVRPAEVVDAPQDDPPELGGFVTWAHRLSERIRSLEERVVALERADATPSSEGAPVRRPEPIRLFPTRATMAAGAAVGADRGALSQPAASASRPWTDEEKQALVDAIGDIRYFRKSRALPNIVETMNEHLGYSLKERAYNGFGTATAMFDRGKTDGLLEYGPRSGPNPTIYLPDEEIPVAS